jgi:hypothetical protein
MALIQEVQVLSGRKAETISRCDCVPVRWCGKEALYPGKSPALSIRSGQGTATPIDGAGEISRGRSSPRTGRKAEFDREGGSQN